jgi:AcrR family transcriptional regulator
MTPTKTRSTAVPLSRVRVRTRALLIDSALALFREKHMRVPAIHEIAARAGVATGTFYNYFRTREELLEAAIIEGAERLQNEIVTSYTPVADAAERVSIGTRRFILRAKTEPMWAAGLLRVWSSNPSLLGRMLEPVFASLRTGRRQGRFTYRSEGSAADLCVGPVAAGMRRVIDEGGDAERHGVAVAALILRGLGIRAAEADAIADRPLPEVSDVPQGKDRRIVRAPRRRV